MVKTARRADPSKDKEHTQAVWQGMSFRLHVKPETKDGGDYYHIVIRPKEQFTSFRTQNVGEPGGLLRLTGRRLSGSWTTQAWLVSKCSAHIEGRRLVADNRDVQDLLKRLGNQPVLEKDSTFTTESQPDTQTAATEHAKPQVTK